MLSKIVVAFHMSTTNSKVQVARNKLQAVSSNAKKKTREQKVIHKSSSVSQLDSQFVS